jgi:hypothetical protein
VLRRGDRPRCRRLGVVCHDLIELNGQQQRRAASSRQGRRLCDVCVGSDGGARSHSRLGVGVGVGVWVSCQAETGRVPEEKIQDSTLNNSAVRGESVFGEPQKSWLRPNTYPDG